MEDGQAARHLGDLLEIGLGNTPAQEIWRELMSITTFFPGRGTLLESAYLDGAAKGESEAILRFLAARGIPVPEEARERIAGCTDLDLLGRWLDRTPHVQCVHELFAEEPEDTGTASA
ncbi:hypothetical protein [Streptomyces puniciscabiei]|uniref:hypothetical protein n=1 Tax=Streptomyces puniciscabiei TaxID=164348 RepID=UPI0037942513